MEIHFAGTFTEEKKLTKTKELTENVANLVPKTETPRKKSPRYRSVYGPAIKEFYESQKTAHKTMGIYKIERPNPANFLKKHSGSPICKTPTPQKELQVEDSEKEWKPNRKTVVPRCPAASPSTKEPRPCTNYVRENMRAAIRLPQSTPVPKRQDSNTGHAFLLEFSGLVPRYVCKEDYGKVPRYLVVRGRDMERSEKKYLELLEGNWEKKQPKKIKDDERQILIQGLKNNWQELNTEYLKLPVSAQTPCTLIRKVEVEEKIRAIERNLDLLQHHAEIYVMGDDDEEMASPPFFKV